MKPALSVKRKRFAEEYLIDLNGTQAAIRAGYAAGAAGATAAVTASRLLSDAKVAAYIAQKQAKIAEKIGLSQEWVLTRLRENVERAMQAEPVVDKLGRETGEYRYEGSVANRALELIGKHHGMFVERLDVRTADLGHLTESQLLRLRNGEDFAVVTGAASRG